MGTIKKSDKKFWIDKSIGIVFSSAEMYAIEYYPGIPFKDVFGSGLGWGGAYHHDNDNNPAIYEHLIDLIHFEFDVEMEKAENILLHIKVHIL